MVSRDESVLAALICKPDMTQDDVQPALAEAVGVLHSIQHLLQLSNAVIDSHVIFRKAIYDAHYPLGLCSCPPPASLLKYALSEVARPLRWPLPVTS